MQVDHMNPGFQLLSASRVQDPALIIILNKFSFYVLILLR